MGMLVMVVITCNTLHLQSHIMICIFYLVSSTSTLCVYIRNVYLNTRRLMLPGFYPITLYYIIHKGAYNRPVVYEISSQRRDVASLFFPRHLLS